MKKEYEGEDKNKKDVLVKKNPLWNRLLKTMDVLLHTQKQYDQYEHINKEIYTKLFNQYLQKQLKVITTLINKNFLN
ncbi:hypothetical protein MCFN_02765 [Mycoplasmopsis californica]|uniref:Uncharacterized protein n=1 Tax=Mycoplasmopsis californica TaxID=2113 RepID=A0A059XWI2_9BACT|nr:hypothetical protein MCFN_02765 [Mycoplasmopsis californica]